jgi:hypothetical protein
LLSTETVSARPIFERTFREYGLPRAIRTHTGVPFGTHAILGLPYLNVWWMRLGIQHQRIHPGCPQENDADAREPVVEDPAGEELGRLSSPLCGPYHHLGGPRPAPPFSRRGRALARTLRDAASATHI